MLAAQQLHNNADVSDISYFFYFFVKMLDTSALLCKSCAKNLSLWYTLTIEKLFERSIYIFFL
jgi:hypothetical protein